MNPLAPRPDAIGGDDHTESPSEQRGLPVRRRILMVSPRFAPFVGGTEIHTGHVARELNLRGHDVTVLTTDLGGKLAPEETIDGVAVQRVSAWPRRADFYVAPAVRGIVRDGGWDLVHVQGYHTAMAPLALSAAQRSGIATAVTFHSGGHSSPLRNLVRPVQARLLGPLLRQADALIGVSRFEADLFAERLGLPVDSIDVIPNGTSDIRATPGAVGGTSRGHLRAVPSETVILSMGRLVRYKGHHRVIRALPHLLADDPTIKLQILGRGPYGKKLLRLAERLGVADRVDIDHVPAHERQRLNDIMAGASVAVLLSDYESHGMAAHEALSAALPLIVLDRTALSELVSAGAARAVPPGATDREVAEIVKRTLAETDPVDGAQPRPRVARHSWASIADRLEARYERALAGPADDTSQDEG